MEPKGENAQKIHNLQWPVFLIAGVVGVIVFVTLIVCLRPLPGAPGQAIPEADARQPGARDRADDPAGRSCWRPSPSRRSSVLIALNAKPTTPSASSTSPASSGGGSSTTRRGRLRRHRPADRHRQRDGDPGRQPRAAQHHEPRRDPHLLDPAAQRQARHGARPRPDLEPRRPTSPAIYAGQCTEFCGLSHANMRMEVVALTRTTSRRGRPTSSSRTPAARATARRGRARRSSSQPVRALPPGQRPRRTPTASRSSPSPRPHVYSGAAPNLTHLMTRNTFAGANVRPADARSAVPTGAERRRPEEFGAAYLEGVTPECLNQVAAARRGCATPPAKKPMYTDPDQAGGRPTASTAACRTSACPRTRSTSSSPTSTLNASES